MSETAESGHPAQFEKAVSTENRDCNVWEENAGWCGLHATLKNTSQMNEALADASQASPHSDLMATKPKNDIRQIGDKTNHTLWTSLIFNHY